MNAKENKIAERMREYLRLSKKLDALEDEIGEMVYRLSDEEDRQFRRTAMSKRYWGNIMTRTIVNNNKLIVRILCHHPLMSRDVKLGKDFEFTYKL